MQKWIKEDANYKKTLNFFDVIENAELLYNVEERTNWGYSVKQLVVCKMNSR